MNPLSSNAVKFPLHLDDGEYDDMKEELRRIRNHCRSNPSVWENIDLEEGDMKNKYDEMQESFRPFNATIVENCEEDASVFRHSVCDEETLADIPLLKESINTKRSRGKRQSMHEWKKKHICKYRSADCCHCIVS